MPELSITKIYEDNQLIGYGGNQDWFLNDWANKAGCASVLGANLYSYYMHIEQSDKFDFMIIMEDLYSYMTPGPMGFPFFYKFSHQFIKRMEKENIFLKPNYLKASKSVNQSIKFVKKCIDSQNPVGVLILSHQARELEEDNWHWVCITGYQEENNQMKVIFSDCGARKEVLADVLFEVNIKNIVKLVSFQK